MSEVAPDILPLLLQQIVLASVLLVAAIVVACGVLPLLRRDQARRPIRVPATLQQGVRLWLTDKDSICPRNTGFGTRRNPRAPPVLPPPHPDDPNDRHVT